jgi:hypothetical protein
VLETAAKGLSRIQRPGGVSRPTTCEAVAALRLAGGDDSTTDR